uniref:C-type lectin domain-containing protein n=1 Tax=Anopheles minimus TaxID=112268 RepID=A0A182WCR2_9DIPT
MFFTNGTFAVVLMVVFVSLSLALPRVDDTVPKAPEGTAEHPSTRNDGQTEQNGRAGRFLLPADFAVRQKKFTIGEHGASSFFRAWRNCIAEGKGLATIESEAEQEFLESMLKTLPPDSYYWIAATNLGNPNHDLTWLTTDLPVLTKPGYLNLNGPTCITLRQSGSWVKKNCFLPANVFPYICEEYY